MKYGDEMRRTASALRNVPQDMRMAPKMFITLMVSIDERGNKTMFSRPTIRIRDVPKGGQTVREYDKYIQRNMTFFFDESTNMARQRRTVVLEALYGSAVDTMLNIIEQHDCPFNSITLEVAPKNGYIAKDESYYGSDDACRLETEMVFTKDFDFRQHEEAQVEQGKVILSDVLRVVGDRATFGFTPSSAMYCEVDPDNPVTKYMNWANIVQMSDKKIIHTPIINSFHGMLVLDGSLSQDPRNENMQYGVFTPKDTDQKKRMTVSGLVIGDYTDKIGGSVIVDMHDDVKLNEISNQRQGKISILQNQLKVAKGPLVIIANGSLRIGDDHTGEKTFASRFLISIASFSSMKPMMSDRTQIINTSVCQAFNSVKPIDTNPVVNELAELLADETNDAEHNMLDLCEEEDNSQYESQIG